jgi:hypothetical protein
MVIMVMIVMMVITIITRRKSELIFTPEALKGV